MNGNHIPNQVLNYVDGRLHIGGKGAQVDLLHLARQTDGPLYVYDLDHILGRFRHLLDSLKEVAASIHYAMKANSNPVILRELARAGCGADVVSAGEIRLALAAGFAPEKIIFSGVGKTRSEIEFAVQTGIHQINVESPGELRRIAEVCRGLNQSAEVAFRMNPDVHPQTHPYITTGFRENKFGMDESFLPELLETVRRENRWLRLKGLTMHIGSQIRELDVLEEAIDKSVSVYDKLRAEGFELGRFDVGGGLGIDYESANEAHELNLVGEYGKLVARKLKDLGCRIQTEPGRILTARAGVLIAEVQYIKTTSHKVFCILNTGMHHLIRPALYQAHHRILPLEESPGRPLIEYDIVGPICESSDFLGKNRRLRELRQGDFVAIAEAGAYGSTMASSYNCHPLPTELVISAGKILS